jgi:enoyl-CoA hydratase/carnithine racemase
MTAERPLRVDRTSDGVVTLTLALPERRNAMTAALTDAWVEAVDALRTDRDVRCVVITGEGKAFCAGGDLKYFLSFPGGPARAIHQTAGYFHQAIIEIRRMEKPVIAAVNGVVAGFSLDLVTESDIPIASEKASFVDPHVSIGYVSSHEMVNMARRVPVAVCMRMALLGSRERMNAQRAYEVGLVTEVVPHEKLMDRARELAGMLLSNSPLAVWGTKMAILQGLGLPIPQAEEIAAGYLEIVEQSEDHAEGPRSFVERRKPSWKAR